MPKSFDDMTWKEEQQHLQKTLSSARKRLSKERYVKYLESQLASTRLSQRTYKKMASLKRAATETPCQWEFAPGIKCQREEHKDANHTITVDRPLSAMPHPLTKVIDKLHPTAQIGALVGGLLGAALSLSEKPQPCRAHRLNNCSACRGPR